MIYLFAKNQQQAIYYLNKNNLDRVKTRIVTRPDLLRGLDKGTLLLLCGEWQDNPQKNEVLDIAIRDRLTIVKEVTL